MLRLLAMAWAVGDVPPCNNEQGWNRQPLWGISTKPTPTMGMEIDVATGTGERLYLRLVLVRWPPVHGDNAHNGFLKAKNVDKMKFYLMWANHEVVNVWDTTGGHKRHNVIWTGKVDESGFEKILQAEYEKCFKHPCYYKIDGKPVFMI